MDQYTKRIDEVSTLREIISAKMQGVAIIDFNVMVCGKEAIFVFCGHSPRKA